LENNQGTFYCYILYSQKLNRFYTGSTALNPDDRLKVHLAKHYGNMKYTSKTDDWIIFLQFECNSYEEARYIESHIKHMKSSQYIRNLNMFPEIILKLKKRFLSLSN